MVNIIRQKQSSLPRRKISYLYPLSNVIYVVLLLLLSCCWSSSWLVQVPVLQVQQVSAFVSPSSHRQSVDMVHASPSDQHVGGNTKRTTGDETKNNDPNEIVARRIFVEGDVDGGYYRSCVRNEAGRFRRLSGTMTPPDDSRKAEIYIEGKRKMVEGFCRWCKKSDVGLSQTIAVSEIVEEEPTGLYDEFYAKMP